LSSGERAWKKAMMPVFRYLFGAMTKTEEEVRNLSDVLLQSLENGISKVV
jgi:hypothetical protein